MLDFWLFLKRNLIYFHSASMSGSVRGISFSLFASDKCFREMFQIIKERKGSADKRNFLNMINNNLDTMTVLVRYLESGLLSS